MGLGYSGSSSCDAFYCCTDIFIFVVVVVVVAVVVVVVVVVVLNYLVPDIS